MRYRNSNNTKKNGVVYTPNDMANYLAEEMLRYSALSDWHSVRILDPAVGKGELLISMIEAVKAQHPFCNIDAVGYETDSKICVETEKCLKALFPDCRIIIHNMDFLTAVQSNEVDVFDLVIANPPYIRTQVMGSERSQEIAAVLNLSGRIDAYYAFLVSTKQVLSSIGVAGYITSNKFLTIKSGEAVRNYMLENYRIHHIVDFGDTKMFSAAVLPCILVFSQGTTSDASKVEFSSVYESNDLTGDVEEISTIFDGIRSSGLKKVPHGKTYLFQQGTIRSIMGAACWTVESEESKEWLKRVEQNTWAYFSALGNIRVGIKTTADNVFIGDNWEDNSLELLCPLITHRNAGQIVSENEAMWRVLYTHTSINGKKTAVDIERYPKTKAYLMQHYEQLSKRAYLKKANRNWYEIWVPQNPDSWSKRKIVFRDISAVPQFWIDESGSVVNGDCYWIEINSDVPEETVYLALAVANSPFIERYYDVKFNTKLYSGKRRYMSQYVEQFPLPFYDTPLAKKAVSLVEKIIAENGYGSDSCYKKELDSIVDRMFR